MWDMSEAEQLWAQLSAANPDKSTVLNKNDLPRIFRAMEPTVRAKLMTELVFLGLGDIKPTNPSPDPNREVFLEFAPLQDITKEALDKALAAPIGTRKTQAAAQFERALQIPAQHQLVLVLAACGEDIVLRPMAAPPPGKTYQDMLPMVRDAQRVAQSAGNKVLGDERELDGTIKRRPPPEQKK